MRSALPFIVAMFVACFAAQSASAYYNPSTGRWLSRDPMGDLPRAARPAAPSSQFVLRDSVGSNHYAFVSNDPVGSVDPYGLWRYDGNRGVFSGKITDLDPIWGNRYGSSVVIRFRPSNASGEECQTCSRVDFVQIFRANWWANSSVPYFWHADATNPPFYDNVSEKIAPGGQHYFELDDEPQDALGHGSVFDAESCALCAAGPDKGTVYGCVKWGFAFREVHTFNHQPPQPTVTLVKRYMQDRWNPGKGWSDGILSEGPPYSDFNHPVSDRTVDLPVINQSFPSQRMINMILGRYF